MFSRITVSAGSFISAILVLIGTATMQSGSASADPSQDDQFLALLSQNGVAALSGVPSLIATAHQICSNLGSGMSAGALVDELVDNANVVTPGADQGRLVRTETRFLAAAVQAYCPNEQGRLAFANPAGWNKPGQRVALASLIKESNPDIPTPPAPGPDVQNVIPPQAVAPHSPTKVAPPVVGPPPGGGGGGGGNGGGSGGIAPMPPMEPGIIALAP
ncbi:DUF732 domain-containing protein [Mycobacterium vicinigordonae]|uniref:DUF732 domain-containing protein n=1 Tax=Mycobacterium vicinigordonae TaxID=1719132 RepID=A0A7D6HZT6_9MYCO|nr:DUF732 domain-containing protein [Mycobacterium vicinigordonae]QLL08895.1 DUF732 domain-containing protein [Mycobacterium vicinigordonae]